MKKIFNINYLLLVLGDLLLRETNNFINELVPKLKYQETVFVYYNYYHFIIVGCFQIVLFRVNNLIHMDTVKKNTPLIFLMKTNTVQQIFFNKRKSKDFL